MVEPAPLPSFSRAAATSIGSTIAILLRALERGLRGLGLRAWDVLGFKVYGLGFGVWGCFGV